MSGDDPRLIILNPDDDIVVLASTVEKGETIRISGIDVAVSRTLVMGHKLARHPIRRGADVRKYGMSIGVASQDIAPGEHVHVHNLQSRYTAVELME